MSRTSNERYIGVKDTLKRSVLERIATRPLALINIVGALAVPAALATNAEASPPMPYVGVATNEIWVPSLEEAEAKAKAIADLGANAVRIAQPYTPGQAAEIKNDKDRLCNAAEAARDNNLTLFITMIGYKKIGEVGFAPQTATSIKKFGDTIGTMIWTLAGPNGCVKDVSNLNIGVLNEVNSKTFFPQEYKDHGTTAPAAYEGILESIYPRLKKEATIITLALKEASEKPEDVQPITVNVIAGDLASAHKQLDFIENMGRAKLAHHFVGPIFDMIATHPYMENSSVPPSKPHPAGAIIGLADYGKVMPVIKKYFGNVPLLYDEFGVETEPPADKVYSGRTPGTVKPVSEAQQASYYREAFTLAACQSNVLGLFTFGLSDESDLSRWQAGVFYPDGTPKTSYSPIQRTFNDAKSGNLGNC